MPRLFKTEARANQGSSLVEALIALPLFILLIFGVLDVSSNYITSMYLSHIGHETLICLQESLNSRSCLSNMKRKTQKIPWIELTTLRPHKNTNTNYLFVSYKKGMRKYEKTFILHFQKPSPHKL